MESTLGYWIQRHDYSVIERDNVSSDEAKRAFESFGWQGELERFDEGDPAKNCPPGIGINNGLNLNSSGAMLLHICPNDERTALIHIHFALKKKILGIFPATKQIHHHVNAYDRSKVSQLIDRFYAGDFEALLSI